MVLFIGSQMASTLVMSVTADKTQQRIMLLLPLVFAALVPNFPAGLIVYWITTNFWTLGQAMVVQRLSPPPARCPLEGAGSGPQPAAALVDGGGTARRPPAAHESATTAAPKEEAPAALRQTVGGATRTTRARGGPRRRGRARRGEVGRDEGARARYPGLSVDHVEFEVIEERRGRTRGVRARVSRPPTSRPGGRPSGSSSGRTSPPSACGRS